MLSCHYTPQPVPNRAEGLTVDKWLRNHPLQILCVSGSIGATVYLHSASLTLTLLPDHLAICQLPADAPFPAWARSDALLALVRTADELSVVCDDANVPEGIRAERGWHALKVEGPLDFSLVGVLADLAGILADAGVSIFAISTFDTDYLLVKSNDVKQAMEALQQAGHVIQECK